MSITVSIDAMGGDNAPRIIIEGLKKAIEQKQAYFKVFGLESVVLPLLYEYGISKHNCLEFIHCSEVVEGHTETRQAIRELRDSSMRRAISSVASGESDGVISAGNTGAYMALSKLLLKTLPGIHRPAITSIFPTIDNKGVVVLDLGANVDVNAEILVQFCIMGQAFAKCVQNKKNPSVGLLNVGLEELKGNSIVKEAHDLIQKNSTISNYSGFIEGDKIFSPNMDVIVTDGFSGNVALKTAEGTLRFFSSVMKQEIKKSITSKLGAFLMRSTLSACKSKLNPNNYNGAPFLGLKSISVKSHGGTDGDGFYSAIKVAIDLIENKVNEKITEEIATFDDK